MKKLTALDKPTVRETSIRVRARGTMRNLVVSVTGFTLRIGCKGMRRASDYEIPLESVFLLGAQVKARQDKADREARKKDRRKVTK